MIIIIIIVCCFCVVQFNLHQVRNYAIGNMLIEISAGYNYTLIYYMVIIEYALIMIMIAL